MKKKLLCLLMSAAIMLSLSACNNKTDTPNNPSDQAAPSQSAQAGQRVLNDGTEYGYLAEFSAVDFEADSIGFMLYHDQRAYMLLNTYNEDAERVDFYLISMAPDGSEQKEHTLPDLERGDWLNIRSFAIDAQGGLWLQYTIYTYENEETGAKAEEIYYIAKCDTGGNVVLQADLTDLIRGSSIDEYNGYLSISDIAFDASGDLYVACEMESAAILVLDSELNYKFIISDLGYYVHSIVPYKDTVICGYYNDMGSATAIVDLENKTIGEELNISDVPYSYFSLIGGFDNTIYIYNDSYIYAYDLVTQTKTELLNWIDTDINYNYLQYVIAVSDGLFIMGYRDYSMNTIELLRAVKTPVDEIPVKTVLTLATVDLDIEVRDMIVSFNRQNPNYRVTINDYSQYNTDGDWWGGYTKLADDLLAGELPDIINLNNLSPSTYTSKGLLEDLYQYIDSDPEISREYFTDGVLRALDVNGKLYQMGYAYDIWTVVGNREIVGDDPGWTLDEMMEIYESAPEGMQLMRNMTNENFLNIFLDTTITDYVDFQTGTCSFNSEQFIRLLEIANTFPDTYETEYDEEGNYLTSFDLLRLGRTMANTTSVGAFSDLRNNFGWYFGIDITYKGFPSTTSSGHMLRLRAPLAICSASGNKDGAWEFIKFITSDSVQSNISYLPVAQSAFETLAQQSIMINYRTDENGELVERPSIWYTDDEEFELPILTWDDIDMVREMVAASTCTFDSIAGDTMREIILEEAAAYFTGSKTAEETANLIQSRISIYVSERM